MSLPLEKVTIFFFFFNHGSSFSPCVVKDEGLQTTQTWYLWTAPTISTSTTSLPEGTTYALYALQSYMQYIYRSGEKFSVGCSWELVCIFNTKENQAVYCIELLHVHIIHNSSINLTKNLISKVNDYTKGGKNNFIGLLNSMSSLQPLQICRYYMNDNT